MDTRLYGVIGHPISHSLSPAMHNAAFKALGLDCNYSAFDIAPEDLQEFFKTCKTRFSGFNITLPHKIEAKKYVEVLDDEAKLIGAVNTVKVEDNVLHGYNTDGAGAASALRAAGEKLEGKRILILGAGGAARAISFHLAREGCEIVLTNRNRGKAISLSKDIKDGLFRRVLVVDYTEKSIGNIIDEVDIIVNATSVGMNPKINRKPLTDELLRKNMTVMDIVYNPLETQLLRAAKRIGCKTIDGAGMLVYQGAESLRIWLDKDAPIDEMRKAVLERL